MGPPPPHPHREWAHPPRRHQDWAHPCDDFAGSCVQCMEKVGVDETQVGATSATGPSGAPVKSGFLDKTPQPGFSRPKTRWFVLHQVQAPRVAGPGNRLHARARPATATVCTIQHANCAGSAVLPHEHEQRQQRRPAGKSTTKARQPCPSMTVGTADAQQHTAAALRHSHGSALRMRRTRPRSSTRGSPQGIINLDGVSLIDTDGGKSGKYGFDLTAQNRTYHLWAESEHDRESWKRAIQARHDCTLPAVDSIGTRARKPCISAIRHRHSLRTHSARSSGWPFLRNKTRPRDERLSRTAQTQCNTNAVRPTLCVSDRDSCPRRTPAAARTRSRVASSTRHPRAAA